MTYIHLPPASKIVWDQAPQWGEKGKNRGETSKTKTGEQNKPSGGIGRGKGQQGLPHSYPFPDYLSARFATLLRYLRPKYLNLPFF